MVTFRIWQELMMKTGNRFLHGSALAAIAALLGACGSGGSDDSQPPDPVSAVPKSVIGMITGFGSIYVNGVRYDTSNAIYDVDDRAAFDDSALAVGMVVKVQGSVNADGVSGTAEMVSYDDEVEGIVEQLATDANDAAIKTFVVMGVAVQVDENGTNFEAEDDPAFGFGTIADGDHVEVSGEYVGNVLHASYVEKEDAADDDFEAKGTVDLYDGANSFTLVMKNGASLAVTLADGAEIPFAGIADGQYVEVEGTIPDPVNAPGALLATKVELEDEDRIGDDDDDDVEVKGMLSFDEAGETWSVRDVVVAFTASTSYEPMELRDMIADRSAAGLTLEVEGRYIREVLQVSEIELEDDELEFKADAIVLENNGPRDGVLQLSFRLASGTVDVVVTADTMFLDDEATAHFDLGSLTGSTKLEIDARWGSDDRIYASSLHREDDSDYEITGPMGAIDAVSITVLGVVFGLDESTFFEDGTPAVGDYVEVEDEDGDGFADSVEID
jgi:hypothetical protein